MCDFLKDSLGVKGKYNLKAVIQSVKRVDNGSHKGLQAAKVDYIDNVP